MDKQQIYERAAEILTETGRYDDSYVQENYSGRAMYGAQTPAIVSNAPGSIVGWAVCCALIEARDNEDDYSADEVLHDYDEFIPSRQDSMGRTASVYY